MEKNIYGYARVSTKEQKEDRQIEALKEYGVLEKDIFVDKKSGKDFDRDQYQLLKRLLERTENNILVIKSIDRLGRNYKQIQEEWKEITQNLKTDIVVLDMPMLDTRQYKDLLGSFISDLIISVLGLLRCGVHFAGRNLYLFLKTSLSFLYYYIFCRYLYNRCYYTLHISLVCP